jgi:WxcM-like, C-terminal
VSLASVYDCSLITLPKISDRKGSLTSVHGSAEVPFDIQRVFYLYDIPGGESRGAHAHRQCHQFLVAASGSFEVLLDDGKIQRQIQLNRPYLGLHVPPMIWASEVNFSSGAICLVLASALYDEFDYIRDYTTFKLERQEAPSDGIRFQQRG